MKILKISRREILRGMDKEAPLTKELEKNLIHLLDCLNGFRDDYDKPMVVSNGYRSLAYNEKIGGAKNSAHLYCMAADFYDWDGDIKNFVLENPDILEKYDLYMESPLDTVGWCHLQTRPTKNRIFRR